MRGRGGVCMAAGGGCMAGGRRGRAYQGVCALQDRRPLHPTGMYSS